VRDQIARNTAITKEISAMNTMLASSLSGLMIMTGALTLSIDDQVKTAAEAEQTITTYNIHTLNRLLGYASIKARKIEAVTATEIYAQLIEMGYISKASNPAIEAQLDRTIFFHRGKRWSDSYFYGADAITEDLP
jgi:hypothetical protein